jgi:light-regulated signal transduction histidine kinase (bacteriophytochrome)
VITNPNFAAYVGQTPETLNGELGSTWFPGYLTNGVFDMYKKTHLTGETLRTDIHYNVDQHDIYLDLQSMKVGEEVLVTFNDYTALKKTQLELENTVEELKRTNENLEEFAYAASHDLKEPVRKIQVFTDRLRSSLENVLDDEQRRFFDRVEFAAKRMSSLIDDLLLYSFITKGATFENEVNLNEKVALVLQDLDLEIEQKGARIMVGQLPVITAHRRQMQQLFHNLIGNALKYSKTNVPPEVYIQYRKVKGKETPLHLNSDQGNKIYHLIQVKDNGIGFQQEDAERIFNVFTRLHGNTEYRGSGVGLSIVQRIVENHEGFVWAEGQPGIGATFFILLPK